MMERRWHFFRQRLDERVLRSNLPKMDNELSCSSIFRMNFIASCSGLVVCLHELVELWLRPSGQAAGRRALSRLHLFGFSGFNVTSNDEDSFALVHASRRSYKMLWRRTAAARFQRDPTDVE
jgi:hypothetical protein